MWVGWKAVTLGVLSGGVLALVLYSAVAPGPASANASIPVTEAAASVVYADCVPPAQLENGECVTHLTVTTTVPAPVSADVGPAPAAGNPALVAPSTAAAAPPTSVGDDSHAGDDDDEEHADHEDGGEDDREAHPEADREDDD